MELQNDQEMQEAGAQEETTRTLESGAVDAAEVRRDFTRLGLWLVCFTVAFNGIQYLAVWIWKGLGFSAASFTVRMWVQLLPAYLIVVPLILLLGKRLPGKAIEKKKIRPGHFFMALACCLGITITCNLIGLIVTGLIGRLVGIGVENVSLEIATGMGPLTGVFLACIGAPVCEELICRKMLVTRTLKYGEGVAILLSGLVFGLIHGNLNQFAYAFGLGVFFAYIFVKTGDIRITIGLHACVNFLSSVVISGLIGRLDVDALMEFYGNL